MDYQTTKHYPSGFYKTLTQLEETRLARINMKHEKWYLDDGLDYVFSLKNKKIEKIPSEAFANFEPYTWSFLLMSHPEYADLCPWKKLSLYQLTKIKAFQSELITPEHIAHLPLSEQKTLINTAVYEENAEHTERRSRAQRTETAQERFNEQAELLDIFLEAFKKVYCNGRSKTIINERITIDIGELIGAEQLLSTLFFTRKYGSMARLLKHLMCLLEDIGWIKDVEIDWITEKAATFTIIRQDCHMNPVRLLKRRLAWYLDYFTQHKYDVNMVALEDFPNTFYRKRMYIDCLVVEGHLFRSSFKNLQRYCRFIWNDLTYSHFARLSHANGVKVPYCRACLLNHEKQSHRLIAETEYLVEHGYLKCAGGEITITDKGYNAIRYIDLKMRSENFHVDIEKPTE